MTTSPLGHTFQISIHAPREGGDGSRYDPARRPSISIHAPREGGDPTGAVSMDAAYGFQSTPPARGATNIAQKLGRDN